MGDEDDVVGDEVDGYGDEGDDEDDSDDGAVGGVVTMMEVEGVG